MRKITRLSASLQATTRIRKQRRKSWAASATTRATSSGRDSDGYYRFVGRNDDVIKCSGYRIGPFEVESALIAHDAVVECAITRPDPVRGQVVKATVVLASGYTPSPELTKEQQHVKKSDRTLQVPAYCGVCG